MRKNIIITLKPPKIYHHNKNNARRLNYFNDPLF